MIDGETEKLVPLAELPKSVPSVAVVYQFIVFPAEVAFRFTLLPLQIEVPILGITDVGTDVLLIVTHGYVRGVAPAPAGSHPFLAFTEKFPATAVGPKVIIAERPSAAGAIDQPV